MVQTGWVKVVPVPSGIPGIIVTTVEPPVGRKPNWTERKLQCINKRGDHFTFSVPSKLINLFEEWVVIESIEPVEENGLLVRPVQITPVGVA